MLTVIDSLEQKRHTISLVGTSAGGSCALNAFIERKVVIHKVISICGRLKIGPTSGFRSFESRSKSSRAFAQSVQLCEKSISALSKQERAKIMSVRPQFGDEVVPPQTTYIQGVYNITIPTIEHVFSIGMALTLFSKPLILFLKEEA